MTQSKETDAMIRIAVAQTTATDDFNRNLQIARDMVSEAAAGGARLLAFPEVFLFVGERTAKIEAALSLDGDVVNEFRELAAQHRMSLALGSIHERIADNPERVHNTSVLIGEDGAIVDHYRKINLFGVDLPGLSVRESDTIVAGTAPPPVVDSAIGRLGLTVCFDLRFPALYQGLRQGGAQIVFVPSNFTVPTGRSHWQVLLRARAIEGQYFIVAAAQVGQHNPRYSSYGHSMVVDPWGEVIMLNADRVGVSFCELDLRQIGVARERLPLPNPGPCRGPLRNE